MNQRYSSMQKTVTIFIALTAWFAVLVQYYLMIENRTASIGESTIRFFSFFTILTNTLVAVYFSARALNVKSKILYRSGILTAVTTYITLVGLVYQFALRHLWKPQGMQMIVDELLHTVVPLLVILFWYFYEDRGDLQYSFIPKWLLYPFFYMIYILIRGAFSGFYPYPFVNVISLGYTKVLLNGVILVGVLFILAALFIKIGKSTRLFF
jgi:hypothetical protein